MAQTRGYSNVLPYMTNHNVNGTSERMKEREKAHLARERNVDQDGKKVPSFPSPVRVQENDRISAIAKNVLGDFKRFQTITSKETCIGVVPVPATPTEPKSYFGPGNEFKERHKKRIPERLKDAKTTEKAESKINLDPSKLKGHKSSEKLKFADYKAKEKRTNDVGEVKSEVKSYQNKGNTTSIDKSNNSQKSDVTNDRTDSSGCTKTSDDLPTNGKSQEVRTTVKTIKKPDESSGAPLQESSSKVKSDPPVQSQKCRPTPLQIPARDNNSSSKIQSPHNDMKVENILKEMTEPVTQPPLTGIYTPVPKFKSHFSFTKEKEDLEISNGKNPLGDDLVLTDDDSEEEQDVTAAIDGRSRTDDWSRSRSSSSSSSGSSDDSGSSDSENEETAVSTVPKPSNLNAISPPVQLSSAAGHSTLDTSNPEKVIDEGPQVTASVATNVTNSNINLCPDGEPENRLNSSSLSRTDLPDLNRDFSSEQNSRTNSEKEDSHFKSNQRENTLTKCNFSESKPEVDSKIRTESKKHSKEAILSIKAEQPTQIKVETKDQRSLKGDADELETKQSHDLGLNRPKDDKNLNEVFKRTKTKDSRKEKESDGRKRKPSKSELDNSTDIKKSKHKMKPKVSDRRESSSKKKVETPSSKTLNFTKTLNKELKEPSKKDQPGLNSHIVDAEGEGSDVDVVTCESPEKKRKLEILKKDNCNGVNGHTKNGHHDTPLDIEIVHDQDKEPKSLLVRIDLSLLKRIPKKALGNSRISVGSALTDVEFSSIVSSDKRPSHLDRPESERKVTRKEHNVSSEDKISEETLNGKKRHQTGLFKRSPSCEKDQYPKKRPRRDSDRDRNTSAYSNDRQRPRKTVEEQNAEVEEDIRKLSPDSHLQKAKTLKREADKLVDRDAKSRAYVEALIRFICCGRAWEDKEETERAGRMYSETTDLLKFVLKHVLGRSEDKRLLVLCLRLQSVLFHKLYCMKSRQAIRNSQILSDHFKATHRNNITSPYTANNRHASTPSPMSPTPSPAGSVGSIGSSSSGEGNNGSSHHTSRPLPHTSGANSSVTSPVSISIPQRIHTIMQQHVSTTSRLVLSVDTWDKADNLMADYKDFFSMMDSLCGALTFHSSIAHVVNYLKKSLSKLQDHGKAS